MAAALVLLCVSPVGWNRWKWKHAALPHWLPAHEVWGQPDSPGWQLWCGPVWERSAKPRPAPVHPRRPRRHILPDQCGPRNTRVQHPALAWVWGADPSPPQQLLPWQGLHRHWSDHQRQHGPSEQPGPLGHPWRRVVCLLLHQLPQQHTPHNVRVLLPSHAAIAKNAKEGNSVQEMPVQELEILLKNRMDVDQNLQIFYDNCMSPSPLPLHLQHTIWKLSLFYPLCARGLLPT